MEYLEFLETKKTTVIHAGIKCDVSYPFLYPFQQFCVKKALEKGRFALFEDCGLGKTRQQLVWANEVVKHTNKSVLILAPLAVVNQTINEANAIGIKCTDYDDYSNVGDTVFTPFMGIGSEIYQAIKMGRIGVGFELKDEYFNLAVKNIKDAEMSLTQNKLF